MWDKLRRTKLRRWAPFLLPAPLYRLLRIRLGLLRARRALNPASAAGGGLRHGLPGDLIVSLTSYPRRFPVLHLTLRSLLNQSMPADRVILWIAANDWDVLPKQVKSLKDKGLEIRLVEDLRSYKKLVFAVAQFPEAYIATADDDVFYPRDWLTLLVSGQEPGHKLITCHRAHRIPAPDEQGVPPYMTWSSDVQDDVARAPSVDLLATGVGGILYPPHSLHADVVDSSIFMELCPTADDLWFYWMARRNGARYKKVGGVFDQLVWPTSQDESLFSENEQRNDEQVQNLLRRYGLASEFP